MKTIYLDQNQWVRLAKARVDPEADATATLVNTRLENALKNNSVCLPLTAANIYETFKINDPARREHLAFLQSGLSQGMVFVSRRERLTREIANITREICGLSPLSERPRDWFLSDLFFEAFASRSDKRIPLNLSEHLVSLIKTNPGLFLFNFWTEASSNERVLAVQNWSQGSEELRLRLEKRRASFKNESINLRRRAYSAAILIDEIEAVLEIARDHGAQWESTSDLGEKNAKKLVREVPIFYVERELALRIEEQPRALHENDFRDMATFCAVLPYADVVIAEKQFVNLSIQAGLDKKYRTLTSSKLETLVDLI
nr:hypothetical protein [uncultured Roseibium sp.]